MYGDKALTTEDKVSCGKTASLSEPTHKKNVLIKQSFKKPGLYCYYLDIIDVKKSFESVYVKGYQAKFVIKTLFKFNKCIVRISGLEIKKDKNLVLICVLVNIRS